jgi:transcriptional regulator with XRE-family HTH domain
MNVLSECIVVAEPIPPVITWSADLDGNLAAVASTVAVALPPNTLPAPNRPLHRLGEARRREGLTRRAVARRMGISVHEVEEQEQCSSDILLSDLQRWQKALAVPITELLSEPDGELSPPVKLRARMMLVMKTVRSIQERAQQPSLRRLADRLVAQLVEVMPELEDTTAWPAFGHRRKRHELGQAFFRRLSLDPYDEVEGPER